MIRRMQLSDTETKLHERNVAEITAALGVKQSLANYACTAVLNHFFTSYDDTFAYTDKEGKVYCLMGANERGEMFMLFADIKKLPLSFYKEVTKLKKAMVEKHGTLTTDVMEENVFAMRLAEYWHATFGKPFKISGKKFIPIEVN